MKKLILSLILLFTLLINVNAEGTIRERNIDEFNTILVNVPSRVIYHYSPIYGIVVKLESNDEFSLNTENIKIDNLDGKLGINVENLRYFDLENFYNTSPDNIIINIYAPKYPRIKTTSRNLWISSVSNKIISTENDKI